MNKIVIRAAMDDAIDFAATVKMLNPLPAMDDAIDFAFIVKMDGGNDND